MAQAERAWEQAREQPVVFESVVGGRLEFDNQGAFEAWLDNHGSPELRAVWEDSMDARDAAIFGPAHEASERASAVPASGVRADSFRFYDGSACDGGLLLTASLPNPNMPSSAKNKTSSVRLPPWDLVVLYSGTNYSGSSLILENASSLWRCKSVTGSMNNNAESFNFSP